MAQRADENPKKRKRHMLCTFFKSTCPGHDATSVTVPDTFTSVGKGAFHYCNILTSIELPDTLTSIEESAFGFCSGLTSLTLPESLTSVGPGAFFGAKGLTALSLPNSLTTIGEGAFRNCTGLTTLTPVFAVFVCICLPLLHVFITSICCVML